MRIPFALVAVCLGLAPAAPAADADFDALVRGIESHYGTKRLHIPLFGVAKFFVRVARPEGVKQLDLAIFEEIHYTQPDEREFDELVRNAVGGRWRPMVRVRSRADNERTYIYAREEGGDVRMMIANFEPSEAVVIQYRVSTRTLLAMLDHPDRIGKDK